MYVETNMQIRNRGRHSKETWIGNKIARQQIYKLNTKNASTWFIKNFLLQEKPGIASIFKRQIETLE